MKQDMQGMGSAITYARRYCLASICGCCPDDDDGQAACAKPVVVPHVPKKLSSGMLKVLEDTIGNDIDFLSKVLDHYEINTLEELPVEKYDTVLTRAKKKNEAPNV